MEIFWRKILRDLNFAKVVKQVICGMNLHDYHLIMISKNVDLCHQRRKIANNY